METSGPNIGSYAQRGMGPVSPCLAGATSISRPIGKVCDVCIWQDIEFWLGVVVWDSLVPGAQGAADV
jgi:hypothetical protein